MVKQGSFDLQLLTERPLNMGVKKVVFNARAKNLGDLFQSEKVNVYQTQQNNKYNNIQPVLGNKALESQLSNFNQKLYGGELNQ